MSRTTLKLALLALFAVPARAQDSFEGQAAMVLAQLRAQPAWAQAGAAAPPRFILLQQAPPAKPVPGKPVPVPRQDKPLSPAQQVDEAVVTLVEASERAVFAVLPARGVGSGFIVSADGLAVTNAHVVGKTEIGAEVEIRLPGRKKAMAKLVAKSKKRDLALLKLLPERQDWPFLRLADSRKVRRGVTVVALGSPMGLHESVTKGIVSAVHRTQLDHAGIDTPVVFVQTDASVNPGNSGGPLLALDGTAVGVNTQIISRTGQSGGLNFAISADDVKAAVEQFRRSGNLDSGRVGVAFAPTSDQTETAGGAVVSDAPADLPAAQAGLQAGDVVTAIDGEPLPRGHDEAVLEAVRLIARKSPGEKVTLTVKRGPQNVGHRFEIVAAAEPVPTGPSDLDMLQKELDELRKKIKPDEP